MNYTLIIFLVLAFVAGVLLIEGIYLLWNEQRGPEAQRLERRLQNLSAGGAANSESIGLLKRNSRESLPWIERLILSIPRFGGLDRLIAQSGMNLTISMLAGWTLIFACIGGLVSIVFLRAPIFFVIAQSIGFGLIPYLWLMFRRGQRMRLIERDLPEAVDLIARAMQAGHGFSSALQMVGSELHGPIADEFRILSDELAFGLPADVAFTNLANRVPSDDVRFFVIAVLLQRETGGNLVEVLKNISSLVRERLALYGKVRVLAAEGKMSVWVLSAMPIGTALMIHLVNPNFLSVLFTDPTGLNLVYGAIIGMIIGVAWMLKIVRIRV